MAVRLGVDVGGTFTKAVACDVSDSRVVARAVVPTSHGAESGIAAGVVDALEAVAAEVEERSAGPVLVVAHSTTQAVNALLEGDTARVGVLGIGRRPDLRRARRRTEVGSIGVAPGRALHTVHRFVDATHGIERATVSEAVDDLVAAGAEALCASESFGVEDPVGERLALAVAAERGIAACAGHELSGLYGLEMRTVTGALNASILPAALATARTVAGALPATGPGAPLLVMRGDGGAAGLASMRSHPLTTAFSGPAASVAGALRHLWVHDGVIVEVGGTSTNVSVVRGGRPVLAYVRVLEHVTCVRSLDVRVVGVAGGSMLRLGRRLGRVRVEEVGPRSAHIAGLGYCSFAPPEDLVGARAEPIAPRPGDPADHAIVVDAVGVRRALTVTCAANALGVVPEGTYARADARSARLGFEALARLAGAPWRSLAGRALAIAGDRVGALVREVVDEFDLAAPLVVGLGGGAGALVPRVAGAAGLEWRIPPEAEVISSLGDALSLVRSEVERSVGDDSHDAIRRLCEEAEAKAVAAGASPAGLQVETEAVPERRALRAVAIGSVALESGAAGGPEVDEGTIAVAAKEVLRAGARLVARTSFYSVFVDEGEKPERYAVVDNRGSVACSGEGVVLWGKGDEVARALEARLAGMVRHLGPVSVAPAVKVVRGARLVDLSLLSSPSKVLEAATGECRRAGVDEIAVLTAQH